MKKFFNHDQEKQSPLLPSLPLSLSFPTPAKTKPAMSTSSSRYMECLKNHTAAIGGHALDGCGEFAPSGPDALTCGACNCHRNFHRKEPESESDVGPTGLEPLRSVNNGSPGSNGQPVLFRFCPYEKTTTSYEEERKRFRTKFTAEQKEKMAEMAEKVGWRLKKDDEPVVQRFCQEIGVSRRVFKVWMHNNKHTLAKRLP